MNEQQKQIYDEASEKYSNILSGIYASLADKDFSEEALAEALGPYFDGVSSDKLLHDISLLKEGISKGHEEFGEKYCSETGGCGNVIEAEFDEYLGRLPQNEKRPYMLMMLQMLFKDSGHDVDSKMALYLSNLSDEKLKSEICSLIGRKGMESAAAVLEYCAEKTADNGEETESVQARYDDDTNELISAAALYASMNRNNTGMICVNDIGIRVGVHHSFKYYIGKFLRNEGVQTVMSLLDMAAVMVGCDLLCSWFSGSLSAVIASAFLADVLSGIAAASVCMAVTIPFMLLRQKLMCMEDDSSYIESVIYEAGDDIKSQFDRLSGSAESYSENYNKYPEIIPEYYDSPDTAEEEPYFTSETPGVSY